MPAESTVLWDVAEECLDEGEFLVEQWSTAARSARYSLIDLQKTVERRLVARVDALAVEGEEVAQRLLWPALAPESEAPAPRVTAAVLALLIDPRAEIRDRLIEAIRGAAGDAVRDGLRLALQLTERTDLDEPLRQALYATDVPATQAALLAVMAARRVNPGPILAPLLASKNTEVVRAALAAAAAADRGAHRHAVEAHLTHESGPVRAEALRTAFIWNLASAPKVCVAEARAGSPAAMLLLGLLATPAEVGLLVSSLKSEQHRRAALFALGFTGRREAAEATLPFVADADPAIAKLAAEAFAAITGFVIDEKASAAADEDEDQDEDQDGDEDGDGADAADGDTKAKAKADDGGLPPLEEDLAQDLAMGPEDELPVPDADAIRRWWAEQASRFAADERYLGGALLSPAALQGALRDGSLRRAGPLTEEVAIRTGGRVQLPALRLALPAPAVSADVAMHRQPGWH
jgi:uncharacterized protein (TIGR02270 family)